MQSKPNNWGDPSWPVKPPSRGSWGDGHDHWNAVNRRVSGRRHPSGALCCMLAVSCRCLSGVVVDSCPEIGSRLTICGDVLNTDTPCGRVARL